MKFYYDFHIHTCLSPCGDDDMTPQNIIGMASLIGLDVIAVTDHNTTGNAEAVIEASRQNGGPLVLAGMELETAENVHILMLFPSLGAARACGKIVEERRFKIPNKVGVYGHQSYLSAADEIVGEEENLLLTATDIGVYETAALAADFGGVAVPAHIDKPANGIIAILGAVADDMGFHAVEVSPRADEAFCAEYAARGYLVLHDSDSHYLETINEKNQNFLELGSLTPESVVAALKGK